MSLANLPFNTAFTSGNAPTAATAYQLGTALTGFDSTARLTDGASYQIKVYEVDGDNNPAGAYEFSTSVYTAGSPGTFSRGTVHGSSNSNAAVDWSGAGVGATPVIEVICQTSNTGRRLHSSGTFSNDASLLIGGSSLPFVLGFDYIIELEEVAISASSGFLQMRWYEDGVGVDSTGTDQSEHIAGAAGTSGVSDNNGGDTLHYLHPSNTGINNAETIACQIRVTNPMNGDILRVTGETYTRFSAARSNWRMTGSKAPSAFSASGVQLFVSNANFTSGNWYCWEIPR